MIDNRAAPNINEVSCVLHAGEGLRIDDLPRVGRDRKGQDNEVGFCQDVTEVVWPTKEVKPVFFLDALGRVLFQTQQPHVKMTQATGQFRPDTPDAENGDRLIQQSPLPIGEPKTPLRTFSIRLRKFSG